MGTLGSYHKFLLFVLFYHFLFLQVFRSNLGYSVFHKCVIISVGISSYILGYLISKFEIGHLEIHFSHISCGPRPFLKLVCHVRTGLLGIRFAVNLGLFTDMEIRLSGHLDHLFSLGGLFDHLDVIARRFVLRLVYKVLSIALLGHLLVISKAEMGPVDFLLLGQAALLRNVNALYGFHTKHLGFSLLASALGEPDVV